MSTEKQNYLKMCTSYFREIHAVSLNVAKLSRFTCQSNSAGNTICDSLLIYRRANCKDYLPTRDRDTS